MLLTPSHPTGVVQKSRSDREMDSTESASSTANGNSRTAAFAESLRDIAAAFGGDT